MTPLVVSVISISFGAVKDLPVRLPAVSLVKPPLAREKEPSPLRACSPPSPMDRRSKLPAALMFNGTPWRPKVQVPSKPMWTLALSRAKAVALLDSVIVTVPAFVERSLLKEPATWILVFRVPGPVSQVVALTVQFGLFVGYIGNGEMMFVMLIVPL